MKSIVISEIIIPSCKKLVFVLQNDEEEKVTNKHALDLGDIKRKETKVFNSIAWFKEFPIKHEVSWTAR